MARFNYKTHYWCGRCGRAVHHDLADHYPSGAPKCPHCGSKMRTRPHHSNKKRVVVRI